MAKRREGREKDDNKDGGGIEHFLMIIIRKRVDRKRRPATFNVLA